MTHEEIFAKVRTTLVEALSLDEDQVTPTARLKADLGAESIDFLDIVFRLEKQFKITIPREELFPESIFQGDARFVAEGKVTPVGLAELEKQMPFADLSEFKQNPRVEKVEDLFTVDLIVRYLESKLATAK
ncbi:MAG: acyl carrier protein [Planctomycetia bacterium]|nr:acyl carrier protein [Planctomycetia bacterium]